MLCPSSPVKMLRLIWNVGIVRRHHIRGTPPGRGSQFFKLLQLLRPQFPTRLHHHQSIGRLPVVNCRIVVSCFPSTAVAGNRRPAGIGYADSATGFVVCSFVGA